MAKRGRPKQARAKAPRVLVGWQGEYGMDDRGRFYRIVVESRSATREDGTVEMHEVARLVALPLEWPEDGA